jgi:hypothetical protein
MQTNFPHMMPEDLKGDDDKTRFYTGFISFAMFWRLQYEKQLF